VKRRKKDKEIHGKWEGESKDKGAAQEPFTFCALWEKVSH